MKLVSLLDFFVLFIIIIKVLFVLTAIGHAITSHSDNFNTLMHIDPKLSYWKERFEFIFVFSMSLLLIIYFRPGSNKQVTGESRILFFLFGIVLILTAKWDIFIKESPLFKLLVDTFGIN